MKRGCQNKKKGNDDKKGSLKSVNIVEEQGLESDDGDILFVSSGSEHLMDSWILDSTCSFHVTPNKDWFDTYKLVNSSSVLMGNDASCKVIGIRNIRIKMFDGVCHNSFPLDLDDHKNQNGVATDLFCTGVIGHPGLMFLN